MVEISFKDVAGYVLFNVCHPLRQLSGIYCTCANGISNLTGSPEFDGDSEFMNFDGYLEMIRKNREIAGSAAMDEV